MNARRTVFQESYILTSLTLIRSIELKKDTVIVVLGGSGDLAKKKTVSNPRNLYLIALILYSSLLSLVWYAATPSNPP